MPAPRVEATGEPQPTGTGTTAPSTATTDTDVPETDVPDTTTTPQPTTPQPTTAEAATVPDGPPTTTGVTPAVPATGITSGPPSVPGQGRTAAEVTPCAVTLDDGTTAVGGRWPQERPRATGAADSPADLALGAAGHAAPSASPSERKAPPQTVSSSPDHAPHGSTLPSSPAQPVSPPPPPPAPSPATPGQPAPGGSGCATTSLSGSGSSAGTASGQLAVVDGVLAATQDRAWARLTSQVPARVLSGTDDPGARPD